MGHGFTRVIMEKTFNIKTLFSTSNNSRRKEMDRMQLLAQESKDDVRRMYKGPKSKSTEHSQSDKQDGVSSSTAHSTRGSRSLSMSSGSSSAMDCLSKSTDEEERSIDKEDASCSGHLVPDRTSSLSGTGRLYPTTSKIPRPSRIALGRAELPAPILHKCMSEPFNKTANTHRTTSEAPLPTQAPSRPKTNHSKLTHDASDKHMEGGASTSQAKPRPCHHAAVPVETGDCQSRRKQHSLNAKSPKSKNHDTNSSVSSASEQYDASATTSTTADTSSTTSERSEQVERTPNSNRLVKHIEYVCSVMKKKIHPNVFHESKQRFLENILRPSQLQYGYQDERYIKIGSGEFGEVLYGRISHTGQLVAIKALKKDKTDMFALLQEAFLLQLAGNTEYAARYRGLAPFTALGDKYLQWAILCDFIGSTEGPTPYDFRQTLKNAQCSHRTLQLVLDWVFTCTKIAFAVKQFHTMGMLLNDIKADNILLRPTSCGSYEPVFVDFGLASIGEGITLALEVNDSNRAKILKEYSHIAPEVLFGGETNSASDVFSLGKALSLVADAFPVEALLTIISRCTLWNVNERPTVDELINNFHWLTRNIMTN